MYTVTGDFSLMVNWDKFFGSTSVVKEAEKTSQGVEVQKNPSMMTKLIPWITFWIAVSVNTEKGSVIALLVASAIPFIMRKHKFVIWDQLSIVAGVWAVLAGFMPDKGAFMRSICEIQLWR